MSHASTISVGDTEGRPPRINAAAHSTRRTVEPTYTARRGRSSGAFRETGSRRLACWGAARTELGGVRAFVDGRVSICGSICVLVVAVPGTPDPEVGVIQHRAKQARRDASELLGCP